MIIMRAIPITVHLSGTMTTYTPNRPGPPGRQDFYNGGSPHLIWPAYHLIGVRAIMSAQHDSERAWIFMQAIVSWEHAHMPLVGRFVPCA
jgi:hypothetical protein